VCDEAGDSCSAGQNQCAARSLCDATSGECVTTCNGCDIEGVCIADGAARAGSPCEVCDITRSTTALSPAVGEPCGSAGSACSAQDTCDASGVCRPNDAAPGSPCGNPIAGACDAADTCDGVGNCRPNIAANGVACDDGIFCSVGDQCQGGACVSVGQRDCGPSGTCDDALDQCRCSGCTVGGQCLPAGASNANNLCEVCDPARDPASFSPKGEGAFCGPGEQCSATSLCRFTGVGLVSAGFWDTCAIREGDVFCQVAGGPIDLGGDGSALQLSTGQHHTCALLTTGAVRCWGDSLGSDRGQLGALDVSSEDGIIFSGTVQLGAPATFISAGTDYNCAVVETGGVRCWGLNAVGQLGYGHTDIVGDEAADFPLRDVDLGSRRAVQVDAGNNHTCTILDDGAVRCWGRGFGGSLGYGNVNDLLAPPAIDVALGAAPYLRRHGRRGLALLGRE
jgi:Regulator of chromosome condensation (RCC1) repeat